MEYSETPVDFVQGMVSMSACPLRPAPLLSSPSFPHPPPGPAVGAGEPTMKAGIGIHMYACNRDMSDSCMFNSDGDFLIGRCGVVCGVGCRSAGAGRADVAVTSCDRCSTPGGPPVRDDGDGRA